MKQSLTIVLPIHNAEATLRGSVERVIEVAAELTNSFGVLIVDDGSTDDSYDIASEIANEYPQVHVLRQSQRRGLGPTLNRVRRSLKSDVVMVHDGVSSMNAEQLRILWNSRMDPGKPNDVSISDLLRPAQNQAAMSAAHQRLMSFHVMSTDASESVAGAPAPHRTARKPTGASGMGGIPTLPQPNFMNAMGDFAAGE